MKLRVYGIPPDAYAYRLTPTAYRLTPTAYRLTSDFSIAPVEARRAAPIRCEHASGTEDPQTLGVEPVNIEPMQAVGDRHQINACRRLEGEVVGVAEYVLDLGVRSAAAAAAESAAADDLPRSIQLRLAGVDADDRLEAVEQRCGAQTGSAARIDGDLPSADGYLEIIVVSVGEEIED